MMKNVEKSGRIFIGFFGVILLFMGVTHVLRGDLNYSNYWGGVVFAPFAIVVGVLLLFIVVFKWDSFEDSKTKKKRSK